MMENCVLFVKIRFIRCAKTGVHFEICFISVPYCVGFEQDLTAPFLSSSVSKKWFCSDAVVKCELRGLLTLCTRVFHF